ncbi:uncharacterized protein [Equus asinus]|uniref:uncharacterized protein n=1 Tax=Equus asinus TaxID=9793 RepID=UPI0038F71553
MASHGRAARSARRRRADPPGTAQDSPTTVGVARLGAPRRGGARHVVLDSPGQSEPGGHRLLPLSANGRAQHATLPHPANPQGRTRQDRPRGPSQSAAGQPPPQKRPRSPAVPPQSVSEPGTRTRRLAALSVFDSATLSSAAAPLSAEISADSLPRCPQSALRSPPRSQPVLRSPLRSPQPALRSALRRDLSRRSGHRRALLSRRSGYRRDLSRRSGHRRALLSRRSGHRRDLSRCSGHHCALLSRRSALRRDLSRRSGYRRDLSRRSGLRCALLSPQPSQPLSAPGSRRPGSARRAIVGAPRMKLESSYPC